MRKICAVHTIRINFEYAVRKSYQPHLVSNNYIYIYIYSYDLYSCSLWLLHLHACLDENSNTKASEITLQGIKMKNKKINGRVHAIFCLSKTNIHFSYFIKTGIYICNIKNWIWVQNKCVLFHIHFVSSFKSWIALLFQNHFKWIVGLNIMQQLVALHIFNVSVLFIVTVSWEAVQPIPHVT